MEDKRITIQLEFDKEVPKSIRTVLDYLYNAVEDEQKYHIKNYGNFIEFPSDSEKSQEMLEKIDCILKKIPEDNNYQIKKSELTGLSCVEVDSEGYFIIHGDFFGPLSFGDYITIRR